MPYNTSTRCLGGAPEDCVDQLVALYSAQLIIDIALRGPRDLGFATWVTKIAKATGPGEQRAQPGFVLPGCCTREPFGASTRPRSESAMYWISRSAARGAEFRCSQAEAASGTS